MRQMLFSWAATSCFLILAVIALRAAFGKRMSAGLRYALWGLVLLRLLVPVQLFTSPVMGTVIDSERIVTKQTQTERDILDALGGQDGPQVTVTAAPAFPEAPAMPDPPEPPAAPDLTKAPAWLGWVWLGGSVVMALVLAGCNLRFWMGLRRTRRAWDGQSPVSACGAASPFQKGPFALPKRIFRAALKPPLERGCLSEAKAGDCPNLPLPLYTAAGLPSPCLFGVFRPAVYVAPETAADPDALRHVLAHEGTHYRHGDHIWSLLRCAALCVHWWNPLVWLAARLSRRDGELACDEGALKRLGDGERAAYGRTLLALVTAKPAPGGLLTCSTAMTGDKKSLKERFSRIARAPKRVVGFTVAAVLLAVLVTVCAFGQKAEDAAPWEELEADLSLTVEEDGTVRITGTVDGTELPRGAFWWPDDYLFSESPYGELFLVYPPFTDGIVGHTSAWWTDDSRTAVNLSTEMAAMCSSYWPSGYWEFTVDFSGGEAVITKMEAIADFPEGMEVHMHPKTISDEDAIRVGRIAAKLLTAAEECYRDWTEKGGVPKETAAPSDDPDAQIENYLMPHFQTDGDLVGVPWEVVVTIGDWVLEEYEAYPKRAATWPDVQKGNGTTAFDDWRITSLEGPWSNTVDGVDVEVWRINYEFHTTEPDKAELMLVGGMHLTEDGWLRPTYPNNPYFIFTPDGAGSRQLAATMMHNRTGFPDTTPEGVEQFYADVSAALREAAKPSEPPAPSETLAPSAEEAPKWYVCQLLGDMIDCDDWAVEFWLSPGSEPVRVDMNAARYGDDIRTVFGSLEWVKVDKCSDELYPSGVYAVNLSAARGSIWCKFGSDFIRVNESGTEMYFQAAGAGALWSILAHLSEPALNGPSPAESRAELKAALLGEAEFTLCRENSANCMVNIRTAPPVAFDALSEEWEKFNSFAVADLDGDGTEEVVYHVTDVAGDMGGYLIFRWAGPGDVRCYPKSLHTTRELKADGSFDFGYLGAVGSARISFSVPGVLFREEHFLVHSMDLDTGDEAFYIGDEAVTQEEFDAAWEKQHEKPDAEWYEFTEENVKKVLG